MGVLNINKHNANSAAKVILKTTRYFDMEERLTEYIYEAGCKIEQLEAENAELRQQIDALVVAGNEMKKDSDNVLYGIAEHDWAEDNLSFSTAKWELLVEALEAQDE